MKASSSLSSFLTALLIVACRNEEREPSAKKSAPASEAPPPRVLYLPSDEEAKESEVQGAQRRCPLEMVNVSNRFCIDRYEVSLVDKVEKRPLSPFFTPTTPAAIQKHFDTFLSLSAASRGKLGQLRVPEPAPFQLHEVVIPMAMSERGVVPQGHLSRDHLGDACQAAKKRLCRRDEWTFACRGQSKTQFPYGDKYVSGSCNVHRNSHPAVLLHGNPSLHHRDPRLGLTFDEEGPLLRKTGETPECKSRWGDDAIYDMVGNIDEWVSDESGAFLGGFFSRGTKAGCAASIEVHGPEYLDYSLGGRCCADIEVP